MITTLNIHSRYDLEALARMVFKTSDVLNTEKERIRRSASLLKAAVLDSLSKMEVVLDKGVSIPVQCIVQVEFPN
jgi:hypothetical protein